MARGSRYDVALQILDHQLVDIHGRHCGRIDDLEITGVPGDEAAITAILVGSANWAHRTPGLMSRLLKRLRRDGGVRIEWRHVLELGPVVKLDHDAREFGLDRHEAKATKWLWRVPGS